MYHHGDLTAGWSNVLIFQMRKLRPRKLNDFKVNPDELMRNQDLRRSASTQTHIVHQQLNMSEIVLSV